MHILHNKLICRVRMEKEIVDKLFWLVNFIVEKAIEEPAEIKSNFSKMPKDKVDGVKKRDDAK